MNCNKWDQNYLGLAEHVSKWSKDPSSRVGAVIVRNNRVIALGFNGFPAEVEDKSEWLDIRKIKYEMVVHAEVNALIVAGQRAEGATIYVYGRPVCSSCAGAIIQAGIARVVSQAPSPVKGGFAGAVKKLLEAPETELDRNIWDIKGLFARHMFSHARLSFDAYPCDASSTQVTGQPSCRSSQASALETRIPSNQLRVDNGVARNRPRSSSRRP